MTLTTLLKAITRRIGRRTVSVTPFRRTVVGLSPEREAAYRDYFHPKKRWHQILLYGLTGTTLVGGTLWWFFWPHHTFSLPVAKVLRKALWAESDKENNDYTKALGLYNEALDVAKSEGLDPLSDEYTGIEIKIAEMMERLEMFDKASMIYLDQSQRYIKALENKSLAQDTVGHYLQKDLRAVAKYVHLNDKNDPNIHLLLFAHLRRAQEEVHSRLGLDKGEKRSLGVYFPTDFDNPNTPKKKSKLIVGKQDVYFESNFEVQKAWEPFRDEFFNVRNILVSVLQQEPTFRNWARDLQIRTTKWMIGAGCSLADTLDAMNLCGLMLYFDAEYYESLELRSLDLVARTSRAKKENAMNEALKWYRSSVKLAMSLSDDVVDRSAQLTSAVGHAIYSLGVIYLHIGRLDDAKTLLTEGLKRGERYGYQELIAEARRELQKVEEEKRKLAEKKRESSYVEESSNELQKAEKEKKEIQSAQGAP